MTEGLILTADPTLRDVLVDLYRSGLDEDGCALIKSANGLSFNPRCEVVRRHVCAASAEAIGVWLRRGLRDRAEAIKEVAVRQFACPAGPLTTAVPAASDAAPAESR